MIFNYKNPSSGSYYRRNLAEEAKEDSLWILKSLIIIIPTFSQYNWNTEYS